MFGNVYYYEGKDNKIYVGRDIAIAAKIVHNMDLKTKSDLDEYVKLRCAGIFREIKDITVNDLVERGEITKAVVLYKEIRNCSLKDAAQYVEALSDSLNSKEKK